MKAMIISPADMRGKRINKILNCVFKSGKGKELSDCINSGKRVSLAELFRYVSPNYFGGKVDYAQTFSLKNGIITRAEGEEFRFSALYYFL